MYFLIGFIILIGLIFHRGMRRFQTRNEVQIDREFENYSKSALWDYVIDLEGLPKRRICISQVEVVRRSNGLIVEWIEYWRLGLRAQFVQSVDMKEKAVRMLVKASLGIRGTWVYSLEGDEKSVKLKIVEESVIKSPILKLIMMTMGRDIIIRSEMSDISRAVSRTREIFR